MHDHPEALTLSVEATAKALGVSRATAYRAIADGSLPSVRLRGKILVPRHRLVQLLDGESASARENTGLVVPC